MGFAVKIVARVLWLYSFITLSVVLAICAYPSVILGVKGWMALEGTNFYLKWLLRTLLVTSGYFLMGIVMMLFLPIMARLMGASTGAGTIPIRSFKVWNWYNYNGLILTFQTLFGKFWRSSALYILFLRAMGAKIGRNVIVNSNVVFDLDLLEIGDNTVIGGDAAIIGHVGEKGKLVREPIRIGRNCTIGQYTTVFPGATIGDNCHVGAMSLVPKGAVLDSNAVYGGVPVRKLKDLKPGDRSSIATGSEPEALAIEYQKDEERAEATA